MPRMYEDPQQEMESILAWLERRMDVASSPSMLRFYVDIFKSEWKSSFDTLDSIPEDFKNKIMKRYEELRVEDYDG